MLKFRTEKVSERITRIFGFATELMYLVEGDEKAALLDSGSGIGSLRACVDQLTDKPLMVLLTHGHVDHAMGAGEFDEVYMNHEDDYIYRPHSDYRFRCDSLAMCDPKFGITKEDLVPAADLSVFHDLKEGDVFDLGGVHIEIYACPGHTYGSVVMLMPELRTLLLGDACNYFTFMYDAYSTNICAYEESLKKLGKKLCGRYDTVLISHGGGRGHKELIEDVTAVCEDIKSENTDDIPYEFMGTSGLIAKAVTENMRRVDGGRGNIVYNRDKIW